MISSGAVGSKFGSAKTFGTFGKTVGSKIWAQGARAGDPLFLSLEQPDPACDYAVNAGARRGRKRFLLGNGATNVKSSKDQTLGTYTTLLPDT